MITLRTDQGSKFYISSYNKNLISITMWRAYYAITPPIPARKSFNLSSKSERADLSDTITRLLDIKNYRKEAKNKKATLWAAFKRFVVNLFN
jgi:hypothetical protein